MSTLTNTLKHIKITSLQKREEERKYDKQYELLSIKSNSHIITNIEFVEPHESDYISCKSKHRIEECNVILRILHLLEYYQRHHNGEWYEYLTSFKNYNIGIFMEDWYQVKNNHLREMDNSDFIEQVKHVMDIKCKDDQKCEYVGRYQRDRGNEFCDPIKTGIDHKNIALMDIFDSIHTFIFHSMPRRNRARHTCRNVEFMSDNAVINDEKKEEKQQQQQLQWGSTQHVISIINDCICNKLNECKSEIVSYIKQNSVDENKLHEMKRKNFINEIANHLNNKKLKAALGQLYNAIIKHLNNPQSIQECNLYQIEWITNDIITHKVPNLTEYKQNIIEYMNANKMDGSKLQQMTRKVFLTNISSYLDNTKTKAQLGKLYTAIMKYTIPTTTQNQQNKDSIDEKYDVDVNETANLSSNNKFQTKMTAESKNETYYSFGEQYRYTENFQQHPLYVKTKYNTLKEELCAYFVAEYNAKETKNLLATQQKEIELMDVRIKPILTKLITCTKADEKDLFSESKITDLLWFDNKVESKDGYATSMLLKIEEHTYLQLNSIIEKLCDSLAEKNIVKSTNFDSIMFAYLLKIKKNTINKLKELNNDKTITNDYHTDRFVKKMMNLVKWSQNPFLPKEIQQCLVDPEDILLHPIFVKAQELLRNTDIQVKPDKSNLLNDDELLNFKESIVDVILYKQLMDPMKIKLARYVLQTIKDKLHENYTRFIELKATARSAIWIEKSHLKMQMPTVKKLKATWYKGINRHHEIEPGQPIRSNHVLVLTLYTQLSKLCTKFRETYRKIAKNENISNQIKRHAVFANFGRLLYESFVFYGSIENNVEVLYHGISIEILFKT
eukprot:151603_1